MTDRVELPSSVVPIKYNLKFTPDFTSFIYKGEETVEVEVKESTNTIQMHSKEIYISDVDLINFEGEIQKPTDINFNIPHSVVTMIFPNNISVGKVCLRISFQGELNDQMAGFYRSASKNSKGENIYIASTQFESLDARRCFPCWDEPKLKAIFEISMIVDQHLTAFSNMPERFCQLQPDGKKLIEYMPSPKMSTYLVALCVGEFDFVQDYSQHGVAIRVYTPPGKRHDGIFALKIAKATLDMYNEFFKIPYPLPKLDMVAIPEFAMGAMENWGLVTYREAELLLDPAKASSEQKQIVCTIITHELAHQWFGNLVTMEWWDDLWLNEGFATWMQTYAADILFPEWRMWEQFVVSDQSAALRLDSLQTSHPIQVPIIHAEEVEEVFDAISYCKGGCVVRMVYAVLGHEHFQEGLALYMNRFKYSNTRTIDLWTAWQEVSNKPIREMMASWTEQMGFPVIKVISEKWSSNELEIELQQQWFLGDGTDTSDSDKVWKVPLFIGSSKTICSPQLVFMDNKTLTIKVPLESPDDWVKLNIGQHVPLRVAHSPAMIQRLSDAIRLKAIPATDRAGLIMDAFALARAGHISPESVVLLLKGFEFEDEQIVWDALEQVINDFNKLLIHDEFIHMQFVAFMNRLIHPILNSIGWNNKEGDDDLKKVLRGCIVRLAAAFCSYDKEVVREARTRFSEVVDKPLSHRVQADIIVPLIRIVLKNGGEKEYNEVLQLHSAWNDSIVQQIYIYRAIGSIAPSELKEAVLEWALSGVVKLQDFFYPIISVSGSNIVGGQIAWNFFKKNFDKIWKMHEKASMSLMETVISYSSYGLSSEDDLNDFQQFFNTHHVPSQRRIAQIIEGLKIHIRFLNDIRRSPLAQNNFWENL